MKKKILIIFGSANKNGRTNKILKIVKESLKSCYDFEIFDSYKEKIKPCTGCNECLKKITCKLEDFKILKHFIEEKDFIIVASPIYNMGAPSPLKAIFDRFQPYFVSKFLRKENFVKPKKSLVLITSGRNDLFGILCARFQIKTALKSINTEIVSEIIWKNTDKCSIITEELLKEIVKGVRKFEEKIKN